MMKIMSNTTESIACVIWNNYKGKSQEDQKCIQWVDSWHLGQASLIILSTMASSMKFFFFFSIKHEVEFKERSSLDQCDTIKI
jgi:hypothetical protein